MLQNLNVFSFSDCNTFLFFFSGRITWISTSLEPEWFRVFVKGSYISWKVGLLRVNQNASYNVFMEKASWNLVTHLRLKGSKIIRVIFGFKTQK